MPAERCIEPKKGPGTLTSGYPVPFSGAERYVEAALPLWGEARQRTTHTVAGNCMAPLICEGDRIVVEHGPAGVRVGDVVLCRLPEGLGIQRVVRLTGRAGGRRVLVKGDQTMTGPPALAPDAILGRLVEVRNHHRRLRLDGPAMRVLGRLMAWWSRFSPVHAGTARLIRRLAVVFVGPGRGPSEANRSRALLRQLYERSSREGGKGVRPLSVRGSDPFSAGSVSAADHMGRAS